jgi:chromosome partitioning protein
MILTVGHTKGGVGKSTLAIAIAAGRALAGRRVWVVDGDRQGTATAALTMRAEAKVWPQIAVSAYPDGATLRTQVQMQRGHFDDVVIDAGGRDSTALRAALVLSDVLLVPFQPRSFDVWALDDVAALVAEARSVRDGLRALAVLNQADPSGNDNAEAAEAVRTLPAFEYLDAPITRRKAVAAATAMGLCVSESTPLDTLAEAELKALLKNLSNI